MKLNGFDLWWRMACHGSGLEVAKWVQAKCSGSELKSGSLKATNIYTGYFQGRLSLFSDSSQS